MKIDPHLFLQVTSEPLARGNASELALEVSRRWRPAELCPLLQHENVDVRRVAAATIGVVGDTHNTGCLARALRDADAQVVQMAEHSLWSIWFRSGNEASAEPFRNGIKLLNQERYLQAIEMFDLAQDLSPNFTECRHQAGLCRFMLQQHAVAVEACKKAVAMVPAHFGAYSIMGHSYTQMGDLPRALRSYRKAVAIHPRLDAVKHAITRLEKRVQAAPDASGEYGAIT